MASDGSMAAPGVSSGRKLVVGRRAAAAPGEAGLLRDKLEAFAREKEASRAALATVLLEREVLGREDPRPGEVAELLDQAARDPVLEDPESVQRAQSALRATQRLFGRELAHCRTAVTKVSEQGEVLKTWELEVRPEEDRPEVVVRQDVVTKEAPGSHQLPAIHRLKLRVRGVAPEPGLEAAARHCEAAREPQLFIHLVSAWLPLSERRAALLEAARGPHTTLRPPHSVEYGNSLGAVLYTVTLGIDMDLRQPAGWSLTWLVEMTEDGAAACAAMHLPRSLARKGQVAGWTVEYALETLGKVARLDAETPRKELAAPTGVPELRIHSSPRVETPLAGPEKRAKQRKLLM